MQKSFRTTLILLGVCVALTGWYLLYEKRYKPEATEAEEKGKQLVSITSEQVQEIDLERLKNAPPDGAAPGADFKPDYQTIKLRRSGSEWMMLTPIEDGADAGIITSMLGTITTTKHERIVEEKAEDLLPFGLRDPAIRLTLRKDSKDKGEQLLIGANTPVGHGSYAKTGTGKAVMRIARSLRAAADKGVTELRNKSVLGVPRADVAEVEIQLGRDSFLVKREEGKDEWLLAREGVPVDNGEWNKALGALVDLKATDFPDLTGKSPKDFGLASPLVKASLVKGKDKTRLTVLLGKVKAKDKEKYYAKREDKPTLFEVDKESVDKLLRPAATYRSQQLARFNRYDVKRVRLERGTGTIEVAKDEKGTWSLTGDAAFKLDSTKVETLLTRLQDTKLEKYLPAGTPKLGDKQAALTVRVFEKKDKADVEKVLLKFGAPRGKSIPADRADLPLPFLVKLDDFKGLDLKKEDFAQKAADPKAAAGDKKPGVLKDAHDEHEHHEHEGHEAHEGHEGHG